MVAEVANISLLYFLVFVGVSAAWAGVPFIGAVAAGAAGVAAADGRVSLAGAVIVVAVAGEIGGLAGYQIGLKWGRQLVERPGKHQDYRQRMLSNGERAYARWGRLAVFFTPALVSGTAKMPHRQFAIWNLVDSVGFALFTIGGAYGIGKVVSGHHAARDVGILIVFVGVGGLMLLLVRRHHGAAGRTTARSS
jgi:membrane protein DedA with SNARE-associated domain